MGRTIAIVFCVAAGCIFAMATTYQWGKESGRAEFNDIDARLSRVEFDLPPPAPPSPFVSRYRTIEVPYRRYPPYVMPTYDPPAPPAPIDENQPTLIVPAA